LTQGSLPQFPSIWLPMSPARLSRKQNKQPWKKRWKWRNHVQYTHLRKSLLFFFFSAFFSRKTILSDKDYKNTQRPLHVKTHTLKNELELPITLYFHIMPFWKTHPSSTLYVSPNLPPPTPQPPPPHTKNKNSWPTKFWVPPATN
jgi:hypothetical protein